MSRVVTKTGTASIYPSSYIGKDVDGSWYSISNSANAYMAYDQDTSTYCQIGLTRGASAYTYIYFKFDTSSIPANATIDSISCIARVYISNQSSSNIASKGAKMCSGTTEKTSAVSVTTTPSNRTFTMGTWTRAELDDVRLKIYATRNTSNVNSSYYLRCYGATLTVSYTYNENYYTVSTQIVGDGVTVYPETGEYLEGEDPEIRITVDGVGVEVSDNSADVTNLLIEDDGDYLYTVISIDSDHTIVITAVAQSGQTILLKVNGSWVPIDAIYRKANGVWEEVDILYLKQNGIWTN